MFSVHQKVFFKKHTEKVAVNTVVGLLYKVLKNCLLQACDVFDVKMIQIWTFPAAPSTERVPSLAERVAYLRYSINLRLFNWRVPALGGTLPLNGKSLCSKKLSEKGGGDHPPLTDKIC